MAATTEKSLASPHTHTTRSVSDVMLQVALALIPGIAVSTWFFGIGILVNILLAVLFALGLEAVTLMLRKQTIASSLKDPVRPRTVPLYRLVGHVLWYRFFHRCCQAPVRWRGQQPV